MRKLIVPAVVVTLAAVAWVVWPARESAVPPAVAPVVEPVARDAVQLTTVDAPEHAPVPEATPPAAAERTEVAVSEAPVTGPLAILRGRCVDEKGAPIAGVVAGLIGWGANTERTEAWLKDHPEPTRIDEKITTGADGVFEFRFWPPPPFQFALRLTRAGRATMSDRWSALEAGITRDLGDIAMGAGTVLRGSVVDSAGALVVGVDVHFRRSGNPAVRGGAQDWDIGHAHRDSTFVGRWPLAAGEYGVDVPHREVVRPTSVTITGEQSEQVVDVVLATIDLAATISGIVVDETGVPVAGATVSSDAGGSGWINSTDREGRFRVTRAKQGDPSEVGLWVRHDRFEFLRASEKYAWGRSDVRIVLQGRLDIELTVVADGAPVEDFVVRVFPQGGAMSSDDYRPRARGKQPGGRVVVRGVRHGRNVVVVEPADQGLSTSDFVPVDVIGPGPTRLTVSLAHVARRVLRVQRADGTPLADAVVQLVDPLGATGRVAVYPIERWGWQMGGTKALELQAAAAVARGEAELRGPGGRALAVFLPGPANAPLWHGDVRLEVDAPLLITVAPAARLVGSIGPPELLQEWRRLADLPISGPLDERQRQVAPGVSLRRTAAGVHERHPAKAVPLDEAGGFEIEGAAPGTWQVAVSWWRDRGGLGRTGDGADAGQVELHAGEVTRVDLDLAHLLPADLDGVVLQNGVPWANGRVRLTSVADASGAGRGRSESASTDADGRFHLRLRSGEYELALEIASERRSDTLRAEGTVHVIRGERTTRTFHVQSGSARVRLVDASGAAVVGVTIELRDVADKPRTWLPVTGDEGWTTGELEAGVFSACVLPRRLQDQKAQQEVWRANVGNPDPFAAMRLRLGMVTTAAGETTSVELRLPPEFEK